MTEIDRELLSAWGFCRIWPSGRAAKAGEAVHWPRGPPTGPAARPAARQTA